MKLLFKWALFIALTLMILPSCVSNKKYNEAQASLSSLRAQNRGLNSDLADSRGRLQLMEAANKSAAGQLNAKDSVLNQNQQELAARQKSLEELQALIHQQKAKTEALRKKMTDALSGFNSDQLSVFTKNGKVYVSLSEKLLFPSGSAVVNKEAKEALQKVATALIQNPDINIDVEGHTDSVPIKIKFEDNWALSVARATAVVRELTNEYHVNPARFTASGRSKYEPVADNSTAEGRAKNRRTEIILAPKLDELMQLIQGETKE